jgi:hypothetical protein
MTYLALHENQLSYTKMLQQVMYKVNLDRTLSTALGNHT